MALIQRTEELILNQLLYSKEFYRKVYPYLKKGYFHERIEQIIFSEIQNYISEYNDIPSIETISLLVNRKEGISEDELSEINVYISEILSSPVKIDKIEFVIDEAEKFCQDKAMYNAILDSMTILNGEDKKRDKNAIPEMMKDALKVSFSNEIGLDYNDVEERYDRLHRKGKKIAFDIEALNIITKNGFEEKTLNCILASTGVGKTIFMCHCAASALVQGKNVLYITMEMAEEKIAQRIDANLMDIELDNLDTLKKEEYIKNAQKVFKGDNFLSKMFRYKKENVFGRLFIKEYPTASANVNHFRFLLDELYLKKEFIPDFIIIDYINICSSARILLSSGLYSFVKSIAEELRGLAVEYEVPILTATQTNRGGFNNSDVEMTDTSESIGLPATLDFYAALMSNELLERIGRIAIKQLKNRYRDVNKNKYFTIGIDKPKMRFYHVDDWNKTLTEEDSSTTDDLVLANDETFDNYFDKPSIEHTKFDGIKI